MTDVDEIDLRLKKYSFDTKNLLKFKVKKIKFFSQNAPNFLFRKQSILVQKKLI